MIPPGRHFCMYAMAAVLPLLPAKQRELAESDRLASDSSVACPDPDEQVSKFMRSKDHVVSVDTKKKELTGRKHFPSRPGSS